MGISGQYVNTFEEGNLATCVDISLDAGYKHVFFDVIEVAEGDVKLKSHYDGSIHTLPIAKGIRTEFATITQNGMYDFLFGCKAQSFKIVPMKGERI